jgi:hypothetical protein
MEKSSNPTKDPKNMSIGELFAEKTVSVLKDVNKKSEQKGRKAGLQKIDRHMKNGLKIRWTCGVCKAYINSFEGGTGIKKIKDHLKVLDKQGYVACPANGKKHLNRFEVEKDAIVFKTRMVLGEDKKNQNKER